MGKRHLKGWYRQTLLSALPLFSSFANDDRLVTPRLQSHEPGDVALAWLLHQPAVTALIIGPRTHNQLDAAMRALNLKLDAAALRKLDEIFPGHKTAPEDCAW